MNPDAYPARSGRPLPPCSTPELALYWLILLVPVSLSVYAGFHFTSLPGHAADFAIYRTAAEIVRSGQGSRLYDLALQREVFRQTAGDAAFLVWNHHPAEAILYLPAAFASYASGLQAMQRLNVALYCGLAAWTAVRIGRRPGRLLALWVFLLAACPFVASTITMGQDSLWVLALTLLGLREVQCERPLRAGALLGLATVKFTVVLPLLALLWWIGLRRAVIAAAGVSLVLALAPAVVWGPAILADYGKLCLRLVHTEKEWGLYSELLWNFRGLIRAWVPGATAALAASLLLGITTGVMLRRLSLAGAVPLALLAAAFFSPHLYRHDGVFYLGAAVLRLVPAKTGRDRPGGLDPSLAPTV